MRVAREASAVAVAALELTALTLTATARAQPFGTPDTLPPTVPAGFLVIPTTVVPAPTPLTGYTVAPRYVVHQHGTMRMGRSPATSVVNRYGQFWDIPNLFVADGSLFPTAGGYNPTHTIEALAHWVAKYIAVNGAAVMSS